MAREVFNHAKELLMQRRTMNKQVSGERPLKSAMNRGVCRAEVARRRPTPMCWLISNSCLRVPEHLRSGMPRLGTVLAVFTHNCCSLPPTPFSLLRDFKYRYSKNYKSAS